MKKHLLVFLVSLTLFSASCTTTFAGTVLVLSFRDILFYVLLAFVFAILLGLQSEDKRKTFWIWFVLGVLLTPLTSFVALLIKISK